MVSGLTLKSISKSLKEDSLGHLVRMPTGCLPKGSVSGMSRWKEVSGQAQVSVERLSLSAGLGMTLCPSGRDRVGV